MATQLLLGVALKILVARVRVLGLGGFLYRSIINHVGDILFQNGHFGANGFDQLYPYTKNLI